MRVRICIRFCTLHHGARMTEEYVSSPWKLRGSAIYTEAYGNTPAELIADLWPCPPSLVKQVIEAHNRDWAHLIEKLEGFSDEGFSDE